MTRPDLAIVGGGLLGRLLAWRAALDGLQVTLFDANDRLGNRATAWVAAGMVTPQAEAVDAEPGLVAMGRRSLELWPRWLPLLPKPVHYSDAGTILVWQRADGGEAARFEAMIRSRDPQARVERLGSEEVGEKEPSLQGRFREALYLPGEAYVHNRELLPALADALESLGVECHWNRPVADTERPDARLVVDCRGKSAKTRWKELRGVRGEVIRLHAPGVELRHMIRLLHSRYQLYLISRPGGNFVVGATSIESDDRTPVSVRGALELLTAAYAVLPELARRELWNSVAIAVPRCPTTAPARGTHPARSCSK